MKVPRASTFRKIPGDARAGPSSQPRSTDGRLLSPACLPSQMIPLPSVRPWVGIGVEARGDGDLGGKERHHHTLSHNLCR